MRRSFADSLRTLFAALLLAGLMPFSALAESDFASLVQGLGAKGYVKTIKAVNRLAATGDKRAETILAAMLERKLHLRKSDGKVVIVDVQDGRRSIVDPLTGLALPGLKKKELKRLRSNNRLRRALRTAIGVLTLAHEDPERRIAAAEALFKSPKPGMAGPLEDALADETHARTRTALSRALAAIQLQHSSDFGTRIGAIRVLSEFSDPGVTGLLRGVAAGKGDERVVRAAEEALQDIESRIFLWEQLGQLFTGLSLGSVLLLAAVGLAITFGVMGVINMAHGEMVMIGAYATFVVQEAFRSLYPGGLEYSLPIALPVAFLAAAGLGIAIERGVIRYLYERPLETLLATWGISLVLQQAVRSIFGPTNRQVSSPDWMSGAIELEGGVLLTANRIWIIVFSLIVLALLALVLKKTTFGLRMRAVTQNRRMANAMGIRTDRVDMMTFGLGSGIAGMGGVSLSQIDNVSPNLGQAYIVDSFMVVVFGGVGSLLGTLFGAATLGIANKFLETWSGAVLAKILVLTAVILFIQKRPRGLFAPRGRAVEP